MKYGYRLGFGWKEKQSRFYYDNADDEIVD